MFHHKMVCVWLWRNSEILTQNKSNSEIALDITKLFWQELNKDEQAPVWIEFMKVTYEI